MKLGLAWLAASLSVAHALTLWANHGASTAAIAGPSMMAVTPQREVPIFEHPSWWEGAAVFDDGEAIGASGVDGGEISDPCFWRPEADECGVPISASLADSALSMPGEALELPCITTGARAAVRVQLCFSVCMQCPATLTPCSPCADDGCTWEQRAGIRPDEPLGFYEKAEALTLDPCWWDQECVVFS